MTLSIRTQAVLDKADITLEAAKHLSFNTLAGLPNSSPAVAREILTEDWELQCYGCREDELRRATDLSNQVTMPSMIAMSILSDAQEKLQAIEDGHSKEYDGNRLEEARQYINRAKWIISERLVDK